MVGTCLHFWVLLERLKVESCVLPRKYQHFSRVHRSAPGAPLDRRESTLECPDIENYGKRLASSRVLNRRFRGEGSGERVGERSEHRRGPVRSQPGAVGKPGKAQTSVFIAPKLRIFIWSYKNRGFSVRASQGRSWGLIEK